MPKEKTLPAFTLDEIDIHAEKKKAREEDEKKRQAILAMDPGRPGGPMDAMAPGSAPRQLGTPIKPIESDEEKKKKSEEDKKKK